MYVLSIALRRQEFEFMSCIRSQDRETYRTCIQFKNMSNFLARMEARERGWPQSQYRTDHDHHMTGMEAREAGHRTASHGSINVVWCDACTRTKEDVKYRSLKSN